MSEAAASVAGFVLAGGRSSRMGKDKALVELDGRPLIEHALDVLRGAGLTPRIAGAHTEIDGFAPVIADEQADCGPLGGVVSALAQMAEDWAVFVSIDMPLMAPALIRGLMERARSGEPAITVASVGGEAQTFPAVVRRAALSVLERELEEGRLGCLAAFRAAGLQVVKAEKIAASESPSAVDRWFSNLNTPEDLERVRSFGADRT